MIKEKEEEGKNNEDTAVNVPTDHRPAI